MEDIALENHIVKQFDEELDEIRTLLMAMGGMVEQQLQDSIQSIVKVDSGLADSVIERDKRVDEMELGGADATVPFNDGCAPSPHAG